MTLLDQFAETLSSEEKETLADVKAYADWQVGRQETDFIPTNKDDVDIRNFLLHLRLNRGKQGQLWRRTKSLRRFYNWAQAEGIIDDNPFDNFDFSKPLLSQTQLKRRQDTLPADPVERELAHLRALNKLAQQLNQAADIQSTLTAAVETLLPVMNLQTAWVFVLPELHRHLQGIPKPPPHDFALAQAVNLPSGLEMEERRYLCQPGDCHCQWLLRNGRLQRAVNVVECTRVQDAHKANGETRDLFFHASVPLRLENKILGIINVATENWQFLTAADLQFLSTVGAQVSVALERARLYDLSQAQQTRMTRELEMARDLQANLLPQRLPQFPGWTLAAYWQAAREVAGDFYDAFELANGRLALLVADVSDKGAHAALYMAMVSSLIRTYARLIESPAELLTAVNRHLVKHDKSAMFVTIFYGVIELDTCLMTYASAGHDPQMIRRGADQVEWLLPTGPLLGIFENLQIKETTVALETGNTLLLYTDGVTDALNEAGEEYSRRRLQVQLQQAPEPAPACLHYLRQDLEQFRGTAVPFDDVTLLVLHTST